MKKSNNDSPNSIDLLNLSGGYLKENDKKHTFSLLNLYKVSVDEIYKIIDPLNKQAFKNII